MDIVTVLDRVTGEEQIRIVQRLTDDDHPLKEREWKIIMIDQNGKVNEDVVMYSQRQGNPLGVKFNQLLWYCSNVDGLLFRHYERVSKFDLSFRLPIRISPNRISVIVGRTKKEKSTEVKPLQLEFLSYSEREIKAEDVIRLYKDAGWWQERNEQDIDKMLKNEISVGAWSNYMLIGFTRAVTDGQFRAYVEDVVIHSDFQKTGIGTKLVSRLLAEISHIDVISLFCEEKLIPFYEKNNFKSSRSQFVLHRKG